MRRLTKIVRAMAVRGEPSSGGEPNGEMIADRLGPRRPRRACERSVAMDENDHPRGALLFMLVYLLMLAALWTNVYLKLWRG